MERHELEQQCLAAGMKRSSFNNRVAYSPVIEDRGPGLYGLRGESAPAAGGNGRAAGARRETGARARGR